MSLANKYSCVGGRRKDRVGGGTWGECITTTTTTLLPCLALPCYLHWSFLVKTT